MKTFLLLGSGELGKEFTISAKRYGFYVIAVDKYEGAPAMQVADCYEVIDMLDGSELENVVARHKPDFIVPEVESICVRKLFDFEKSGITVVPSANAVNVTMNRKETRELATSLGLPTAKYQYATNMTEFKSVIQEIGLPCVVKPLMSSSGKGQSVIKRTEDIETAWEYAMNGSRGNLKEVIVEEFLNLTTEFTLLTVTTNAETKFCEPVEHVQREGDYRESWQPANQKFSQCYKEAKEMAKEMTSALGGNGLWGVEFFIIDGSRVVFSELSPRPHDTGMVTLTTQNQNEFELHLRAILGWEINPSMNRAKSGASAAILADCEKTKSFSYKGLEKAARLGEFRIFGKPEVWENRRIGVALKSDSSSYYAQWLCRKKAMEIANCVKVVPELE